MELVDSDRLDLIYKDSNKRNLNEKTITNHADLFLQRKNIIMLAIIFGISLLLEIQTLAFDQNLDVFLSSKWTRLEVRDLRRNLRAKSNFFYEKAYLQ